MPEWIKQQVRDGNNAAYTAWVSNISSFIGLQVGSANAVYRVRGIDSSNKLSDALGAACLANVPLRRQGANLRWLMNSAARLTLQISRSAVGQVDAGANGAGAFAPTPTELGGIPIITTDSLLNTETTTAS